jgi:septal ring factor EnvC (AmiA/AmiB activator)
MTEQDIRADFLAAIERINSGTFRHPQLVKASRSRKVKLTFSTVALEAGHSRTLISQKKNCRYPEVRNTIIGDQDELRSIQETQEQQIERLKQEAADATFAFHKIATQLAEADIKIHDLEKSLSSVSGQLDRLLARQGSDKFNRK